jgi:hypothetical protein
LPKLGSEYVWVFVTIELEISNILTLSILKERNMLITERIISGLAKVHGKPSSFHKCRYMISMSLEKPRAKTSPNSLLVEEKADLRDNVSCEG